MLYAMRSSTPKYPHMIYQDLIDKNSKLAVIGLGYVGLPIALEFAKRINVIGFDINAARIGQMQRGEDPSRELSAADFENRSIEFTCNIDDLQEATFFIVAVPTPIDDTNLPDLKPLLGASRTVGKVLKKETTSCSNQRCIRVVPKKIAFRFLKRNLA